MNLGSLYLKINSTGIIPLSELDWVTKQQFNFSRVEEALAIKIGRLLDSGDINIGCRIYCQGLLSVVNFKNKIAGLKLTKENIHNLNIYIFLGFNLTLVSILGFFWFNSSFKNIVQIKIFLVYLV